MYIRVLPLKVCVWMKAGGRQGIKGLLHGNKQLLELALLGLDELELLLQLALVHLHPLQVPVQRRDLA